MVDRQHLVHALKDREPLVVIGIYLLKEQNEPSEKWLGCISEVRRIAHSVRVLQQLQGCVASEAEGQAHEAHKYVVAK